MKRILGPKNVMIEIQVISEVMALIEDISEKHEFWLFIKDGKTFFSMSEIFPDQYDSLIFQGTIQSYLANNRKQSIGRKIR